MTIAFPYILWCFKTEFMRALSKLTLMTPREHVGLMTCLVFIWLMFFSYWEFCLKWLYALSSCPYVQLGNFITWCFFISWCQMGMAVPEGRPPCLLCALLELITYFFCLRNERKFIFVLLSLWTGTHILLAKVFCKPCVLFSNKPYHAEQNVRW